MRTPRSVIAAVVWAALSLSACGEDEPTPPGERVPQLAAQLDAIDTALSARDFTRAERELTALIASNRARAGDELDDQEADRILAAVAQLLATLPGSTVEVEEPELSEEGDEDESKLDKELKKLEEERKKLEEERKKEDKEDGGNGDSGENGPDDGEGN
jgi:hypothetical protein